MEFIKLNPDECCTYLIFNHKTKACILIDPKLDYQNSYVNFIKSKNGELKAVIDTHTHADHLSAAPSLSEKYKCDYYMSIESEEKCVTKKVKNNEETDIGGINLKFIMTPGHTKDGMCIIFQDKIMTGDTLFYLEGGGRDDLPTGNYEEHYKSIIKLCKLPSYLIVYPAHNYTESPPYTLHYLKKINPYFSMKSKKDFIKKTTLVEEPPNWMYEVVALNVACNKDINAIEIPYGESICQSGYANSNKRNVPLYINKVELEELINREEVIILDVREAEELITKPSLEGAINISLRELPSRINEIEKYKKDAIVAVCSSGRRGAIGGRILLENGFERVYVLTDSL